MVENTYFEKRDLYGVTYTIKGSAECISIKIGDQEKWKKGERDVEEPKSVSHNVSSNTIGVRDSQRYVYYKKNTTNDQWKYNYTLLTDSTNPGTTETGHITSPAGSHASSSSSTPELDTASTGTPKSSEGSGEAEDTSSPSEEDGSSETIR